MQKYFDQIKPYIKNYYVWLVILVAIFFRLYLLGYSDFQQDEVGAQNYLFDHMSFWDFLMFRSIGPGQFVVTAIANFFVFNTKYAEFGVRLPFTIAGILCVYFVYKITRDNFSRTSALIATSLFGFSGFFIAFSRLAQYQSIVILLGLISIYIYFKNFNNLTIKQTITIGVLLGIGGLFHYDMITIIAPLSFFILYHKGIKNFLVLTITTGTILLAYYVPYYLAPNFPTTLSYILNDRIVGERFDYDSVYHSSILFKIYHSNEFIVVLLGGITTWILKRRNFIEILLGLLFSVTVVFRFLNAITNQGLTIFSILLFLLFISIVFLRKFRSNKISKFDFLEIWFAFGFLTYGLAISKPLSHTYTFLLPMYLIVAVMISTILNTYKNTRYPFALIYLIFTISCVSFNYNAFADAEPNYPWDQKNYVFGPMFKDEVLKNQIGSTLGRGFGFLYNRDWREIEKDKKTLIDEYNITHYGSNEKLRTSKYYLRGLKRENQGNYMYVYIKNPYGSNKTNYYTDKKLYKDSQHYTIYLD